VVLAGVVVAFVPAAASGSAVSVGEDGAVTFEAGPGERNVVTYGFASFGLEIRDSGSVITPGAGCEDTGSGSVRCAGYVIVVHAGDENDSVGPVNEEQSISDMVYGEEGDDTLAGNVFGGPGNDSLTTVDRFDTADGGPGDDVLTANGYATSLEGGDGNDRLSADFLYGTADGGDGNDVIDVRRAAAAGGPGNDRLVAQGCAECGGKTLDGGEGDDELLGSTATEMLVGGAGADVITDKGIDPTGFTNGVPDLLSGGPGNDVLAVGGARRFETIALGYTVTGLNAPGLLHQVAAALDGGPGDDRLQGGPNRDLLFGGEGDDAVDGGEGFDTLRGEAGNDSLHGGEESDGLYGGPGADVVDGGPGAWDGVDLSGESGPVSIDLSRPGGDGAPGENDTYLPGVDEFVLTAHADRFVAGGAAVVVAGGFGDDVLIGGAGADRLNGDTPGPQSHAPGETGEVPLDSDFGDDVIDGRGGDDTIDGSAGSDTLRGGRGDDKLSGASAVIFYQGTAARLPSDDTIYGGPGADGIRYGWHAFGGPGNDQIDIADFNSINMSHVIPLGRDGHASCGRGDDRVRADYYDGVALDCETLAEGARAWRTARPDNRARVTLTLRCAWYFHASCRGSARLVRTSASTDPPPPKGCRRGNGPGELATHPFRIRAGRVDRVALTLPPRARRALENAGCLLVRADLRMKDPKGEPDGVTRTLALRSRRPQRAARAAGGRFGPDDRETLLVSRSTGGGFPDGASRNAAVSGDYQLASVVAFDSDATDIVPGDSNGVSDVFAVRRKKPYSIDGEPWRPGATQLVSRGGGGAPANGPSYLPDLSGDRHHRPRCIGFVSRASNIVRGDTNGMADAFVQDLRTRRTRRISVTSRGRQANGETTEVQVDGACTRFAFVSTATNLSPARTGRSVSQVYLRAAGKTLLVSRSRGRRAGNGASSQVSLARPGTELAYASTATNLAGGDRGRSSDVYLTRLVRRRVATILVSRTRRGRAGNGPSDQPDIAAGGEVVAFRTSASNLLHGDSNGVSDVALANTARPGRFRFASRSEALGQPGNRASGEPTAVEPGTNVFFSSFADNLQSTVRGSLFDRNDTGDVFFWSALSGNVSLQSRDSNNAILNNRPGRPGRHDDPHVPHAPAEKPAVSYYGNYVLFESPYPLIDLNVAATRFPGLSEHDAALMSKSDPALRQVYLRYIGPR
jgi:Ca2+-binding RTX toxin-like protein